MVVLVQEYQSALMSRRPDLPGKIARDFSGLHKFLLNKWYFDELYGLIFVRPAMWLGSFFWKKGDGSVVDGAINGLAMGVIPWVTRLAGRGQSGYVFHYAFVMLIGVSILVPMPRFEFSARSPSQQMNALLAVRLGRLRLKLHQPKNNSKHV